MPAPDSSTFDDDEHRNDPEYKAYLREQEQEWRASAPREELLAYIDALEKDRICLHRFAARAKKIGKDIFAEEAGATMVLDPREDSTALARVCEIAENMLSQLYFDRYVDIQLAEQYPDVAALLVVFRRYQSRHRHWSANAMAHYKRNIVADFLPSDGRYDLWVPHNPATYEKWAALVDVFPEERHDILSGGTHTVPDGETARSEGRKAAQRQDGEYRNPHPRLTFLHAMYSQGYWKEYYRLRNDLSEILRRRAPAPPEETTCFGSGTEIVVEITGKTDAPAPELPSNFFPGAGSDRGSFRVISGTVSRTLLHHAIESETVDPVQINEFDPKTGLGCFAVVDGWAPDVGTVIRWDPAKVDAA